MEQLLHLISSGDTAAYTTLYKLELPFVRRHAAQLLRDNFQAQEVAQEVMLQIWQQADRFNPERGEGHRWILRLTRRRAIDRIRSSQATRRRDDHYARQQTRFDTVEDFAPAVLSRLDANRTHTALATLNANQRQVLELAFFTGLTYPQIADHLNQSLPARQIHDPLRPEQTPHHHDHSRTIRPRSLKRAREQHLESPRHVRGLSQTVSSAGGWAVVRA